MLDNVVAAAASEKILIICLKYILDHTSYFTRIRQPPHLEIVVVGAA